MDSKQLLSPHSSQYRSITLLKKFITWKEHQSYNGHRNIELASEKSQQLAHYTEKDVEKFKQRLWTAHMEKQVESKTLESSREMLRNLIDHLKKPNISLNHQKSLFRFKTAKEIDSRMLDFIHGSSFLFGNKIQTRQWR